MPKLRKRTEALESRRSSRKPSGVGKPRKRRRGRTAASEALQKRRQRAVKLLHWIKRVPKDWMEVIEDKNELIKSTLEPLECTSYREMIVAWKGAMSWRQDLDDALSLMMAVILSTDRRGDQVCLMVLGPPGSGKTQFCDALLVSKRTTYPLENLSGFISGWKGDGEGDYSALARANGKCLITPEANVLIESPSFDKNMADFRRIFDGKITASFKNMKEELDYSALRTPWIQAGTPEMLSAKQSLLGDRFLKVFIDRPDDEESRRILKKVFRDQWHNTALKAEGGNQIGELKQEAYQRTAGYAEYLRENADRLDDIRITTAQEDLILHMAIFIARMRARPSKSEEIEPEEELASRLMGQLGRITRCLTMVINRDSVDSEVLRRVRKLAIHSSRGIVLEMVRIIYESDQKFVPVKVLELYMDRDRKYLETMLKFMRKLNIVKLNTDDMKVKKRTSRPLWGLTDDTRELFEQVYLGED